MSAGDAARVLDADPRAGLNAYEAEKRLEDHGPNRLEETGRRTRLAMFLDQFRDFMIIVLIAAAVVSGVVGEPTDTIAIIVIVALNAIIGFVQEYKAERAMEALKRMSAPEAEVLRDGQVAMLPVEDIVPGDTVMLQAGTIVPADMRLTEAASLQADESALTGESVAVEKSVGPVSGGPVPLGERYCMAYKGTTVTRGRGRGVVVATGMDTELGKVASLLQESGSPKTPLQKRLAGFGRKLSLAVLGICAIMFVSGLLRGVEPVLMFLTAVSLAVAAIPEALPAVVTISLALGASRMVRENALVRRLPAVETLGSVTFICTDKTGTLTKNRMEAVGFYAGGAETGVPEGPASGPLGFMLRVMAVSNDARRDSEGALMGDPTETALIEAAQKAGIAKEKMEAVYPRLDEVPFDSDRKLMSTLHEDPEGGYLLVTKGALEEVAKRSVEMLADGGSVPVDVDELHGVGERMAEEGSRVLAFGYRRLDSPPDALGVQHEEGLTFIGCVGIIDPPRDNVSESVASCHRAGINTVMITGDHPVTASKIAGDIGIDHGSATVMTGTGLERLPLEEFERRVEDIRVYARVAPEQKLKIVQALQDRGQFVAMTGDGVNDAPALKRADIGVSMGITGTDVAKEASDIILLDDNFNTIVRAVREGRRIYDNIRKFIKYTMTSNSGEIWTLFLAPFVGLPIPLLPIHILWINLVTDGLPGLSLAVEPKERDIMERPPRSPVEGVFAHGMAYQIIWVGLLMGGVCLAVEAWAHSAGNPHWQSMVFTVLCLSQMGNVLAIRSDRDSVFRQGFFSNLPLAGSVLLTFGLQMATLYVPFLNPIFKTQPLTLKELVIVLCLSSVVFIAVEFEKLIRNRLLRNGADVAP